MIHPDDIALRCGELSGPADPPPGYFQRLSGCTCGGIGDTGAHRHDCPWAMRTRGTLPTEACEHCVLGICQHTKGWCP